ncbi:MAG: hypothetical protein IJU50_07190, partial [Lachnospiraceae bacterium]|nr:hypothetical protein [Lachnospiraceae bacterium]
MTNKFKKIFAIALSILLVFSMPFSAVAAAMETEKEASSQETGQEGLLAEQEKEALEKTPEENLSGDAADAQAVEKPEAEAVGEEEPAGETKDAEPSGSEKADGEEGDASQEAESGPETDSHLEKDESSEAGGSSEKADGQEAADDSGALSEKALEEGQEVPAAESAEEKVSPAVVAYNTGLGIWELSEEDFQEGAYLIDIPETDPFFPYQVRFYQDGRTKDEYFMTPGGEVRVFGHSFRINPRFSGKNVTGLSLFVGDDQIQVYPAKKDFPENRLGGARESAQGAGVYRPLEEVKLAEVDLSGYHPIELTMVQVKTLFGNTSIAGKKVIWRHGGSNESFEVGSEEDTIDFLTEPSGSAWEVIAGEDDPLSETNIRYTLPVYVSYSDYWLSENIYSENASGGRTYQYFSYDRSGSSLGEDGGSLWLFDGSVTVSENETVYAGFTNEEALSGGASLKVFEGISYDLRHQELTGKAKEVTGDFFVSEEGMRVSRAGIPFGNGSAEYTILAYRDGKVAGWLPIRFSFDITESALAARPSVNVFLKTPSGWESASSGYSRSASAEYESWAYSLYTQYQTADWYYVYVEPSDYGNVAGAYLGQYE